MTEKKDRQSMAENCIKEAKKKGVDIVVANIENKEYLEKIAKEMDIQINVICVR